MEISNTNKEYHSDGQFIYSCMYHVIFCPKYRRSVLIDDIADRLKELVVEKQEEYKYQVLEQEVMPDHVHMILDVNPKISIYRFVSENLPACRGG